MSASVTLTIPSLIVPGPFEVTATFSEAVTGFDNSFADIAVTNGTVGPITAVSSTIYKFTVIPSNIGTVTVKVNNGAANTQYASNIINAFGSNNDAVGCFHFNGGIIYIGDNGNQNIKKNNQYWAYSAGNHIGDIAFDSSGILYFSDYYNNLIKKVDTNGIISDFKTGLSSPRGLAFKDGFLYVADYGNNRVAKISSDGTVTTFATINFVSYIAFKDQILYAGSSDGYIKKIDTNGIITTFATSVGAIQGMTFDNDGVLYISERTTNCIKKIDINGAVTTFVANLTNTYWGYPQGIEIYNGELYFTGYQTGWISKTALHDINTESNLVSITYTQSTAIPTVTLTTPSLTVTGPFVVTATFSEAVTGFDNPTTDITVTNGTVSPITKVSDTVYTFTVTPSSVGAITVKVNSGTANNASSGITTTFKTILNYNIWDIAFKDNNLYTVTDESSSKVIKISPDGTISTFAENVGLSAQYLTFDPNGILYVSEYSSIKKIDINGTVTTFATGIRPRGLAFKDGFLYAVDYLNNRVAKISSDGTVTTFATVSDVWGLAFDSSGNLYASDQIYNKINKIDSSGVVTVFTSGSANVNGPIGLTFKDNILYIANHVDARITMLDYNGTASNFATQISAPVGLAFSTDGILYISQRSGSTNTISEMAALSLNTESNLILTTYTEPIIPSAPTLTATANTNNISLSWTASTGTTPITYSVLRSTDNVNFSSLATGLSATTYTDSSASTNVTYHYKVVAHNSVGDTNSNVASTKILPIIPSAPTLTATANTNNISLSWTASTGTTPITYNVLRSTDNVSFSSLATGLSGTTYTDSSVSTNITYYYKVVAHNVASDTDSNVDSTIITVAPSAPTLTATANSNNISLSWTASTGTTPITYNVLRSTDNVNFSSLATGLSATTYTDSSIIKGTFYYYKIIAHNSVGNTYSNVANSLVLIDPSAPTLTATANTNNISLSWTASTGTTPITYSVLRSTDNVNFSVLVNNLYDTHYTDSTMTPNVTNYYKVVAHNEISEIESNTVENSILIPIIIKNTIATGGLSAFYPSIALQDGVVDWSRSNMFSISVVSDHSFSFFNDENNKCIHIKITNTSDSDIDITWPNGVISAGNSISSLSTKIFYFIKGSNRIYSYSITI